MSARVTTRRVYRHVTGILSLLDRTPVLYLIMSPPDSHSPTTTSTTPPRPRSSNKALPSPLRPHSAPQPSGSPRSAITPTAASPRPTIGSVTSPATPPPERSKTRARDLLRKHYGLNITPPPPSSRPMGPMDLGQCSREITHTRLTRQQIHRPSMRRCITISSLLQHRLRHC